jgi:putative ABC transport system permease protein
LLATGADLRAAMMESGRGGSQSRGTARLRRGLIVAEVALALMLLVGAGLLGRSLFQLMRVDVGIDTRGLLTFDIAPSVARYGDNAAVARLHETVEARLRAVPGVRAVATTNIVPLSGGFDCNTATVPGRPEPGAAERLCPQVRTVTPSYFETVGLTLRAGRLLEATDRIGGPPVAVVGDALARALFPGEDPVGRHVVVVDTLVEIVGVVDDVKHLRLEDASPPAMYLARAQEIVGWHPRQITFLLRTDGDPYALVPAARAAIADADPLLPLANVRSFAELVQRSSSPPRFRTLLLGAFATLALILAAVGIYGVVSYSVTQRTREMAIRMAIGARGGEVRSMVLRQGLAPVGLGIGLGLVGALAGSRVLRAVLFEVETVDPFIFAAVPMLLLAVAAAATILPARRATRVHPMEALRDE